MTTHFYRMTEKFLKRLKAESRRCNWCGKKLKPGDDVVSKSNSSNTKRFHQKCYNSMFIKV